MSEPSFPKPVAEVVATLTDIFRHQGENVYVQLLENSSAHFDAVNYDNWNGGTTTWALRLETPVSIFASVEPHLSLIENAIAKKLSHFDRLHPNDPIGEVTISPIAPGATAVGQRIAPSEVEVGRLWPEGHFRLFVSHVSAHRVAVSKLKDELELFGISGFVAHEAIQPSLEWQKEIELALRSMHALLALITPDFHASNWTDQEVGWAFGRGVLVVPVRLGVDPYGFAGKVQGINAELDKPKTLAKSVFQALLANPQTNVEMRRALVTAFCGAKSYPHAIMLRDYIPEITDFTDAEKTAMRDACESNDQVAKAYKVPETIYKAFGKPVKPAESPPESDDVPF
jgi:hypothetical protein